MNHDDKPDIDTHNIAMSWYYVWRMKELSKLNFLEVELSLRY